MSKQMVPATALLRKTQIWQLKNEIDVRFVQASAIFFSQKKLPTLTLYTKEVCPLCDDAKELLEAYKDRMLQLLGFLGYPFQ